VQHRQNDGNPETVACLGSSTTAGKGTFNWIDELAKRPENSRFRFINFGVGGDLSFNVVTRLDPVLSLAPDRVIVLIGANDILASVFGNFRGFSRVWKGLSEEPSATTFRHNLELITHRLQQQSRATIALSSLAPVGEALQSNDPVQSRLNELIADYSDVVAGVSRSTGTYYLPLYEHFQEQLERCAIAKPFTRFSFAAFYRDYLFRELILRRSFDQISEQNGWGFHIDGIHLNTKGGLILTDVVQQFLDSPSRSAGAV
jgi:lysophospholipase L1-like esterase